MLLVGSGRASAAIGTRLVARLARAITVVAERITNRLPHFPDPSATCSAHGTRYCLTCHRNPSGGRTCGQCYVYDSTGMHGDSCANRIR
jgi:hypothetical protein